MDQIIENKVTLVKGISYYELMQQIFVLMRETADEYIGTRLQRIIKKYLSLIKGGVYFKEDQQYYVPYFNESNKKNGIEHIVYACAKKTQEMVKYYLDGNFKMCNKSSEDWWYEETKNDKKALPLTYITPENIFYRIRIQANEFKGFERKDLFHVPFEKRGYISTNRYSVLGHPCLYLGRSIYTCWEEAHRPKLDNFFVTAVKTTQDKINLLDFRLFRKDFSNYWEFRKYLCVLPMIIGCSLRVKMSDEKFRAEYILPQQILHQIITSTRRIMRLEGVMFTSTQVEEDFGFNIANPEVADNIAIPIQINMEKGWCPYLCNNFALTVPTNYEYELIKHPIKYSKANMGVAEDGTIRLDASNSDEEDFSPFQLMEKRLTEREFMKINCDTGIVK